MNDPRLNRLARILVRYSLKVKPGETVLIRSSELAKPLVLAAYREVLHAGGHPRLQLGFEEANEIFFREANDRQLREFPQIGLFEAKHVQAMIAIYAPANLKGMSAVPPQKSVARARVLQPVQEILTEKVRWVLCNYPTPALAQEAEMSLEEYERFVFSATNLDWAGKKDGMTRIARAFEHAKTVRIVGKDTDLTLGIRGRRFIVAAGESNMPDGEIFTGPLEDATEGHIYYEFPAIYGGREVLGVRLWFEGGKVVKAAAEKNERYLKTMIAADSGARILGELGIGCNEKIRRFTKDILFDEKIGGTVHLALGKSYPETRGLNKSAIHWDMIKDLRRQGEIYLDGKLVQKNGKFLI
jgi:aminopeptidase